MGGTDCVDDRPEGGYSGMSSKLSSAAVDRRDRDGGSELRLLEFDGGNLSTVVFFATRRRGSGASVKDSYGNIGDR